MIFHTRGNREATQLLRALQQLYPATFCKPRKPLAEGIHHDIRKEFPQAKKRVIRAALYRWCRTPDYLDAIAAGEWRRDLKGLAVGLPSQEQRDHAAQRASRIRQRRRKAG